MNNTITIKVDDIVKFKRAFNVTAALDNTGKKVICVPLFNNDIDRRQVIYVPYYFNHYKVRVIMLDKE